MENIKQILENRIAELYKADELFCKDRWDMTKNSMVRALAREGSNQVTFARQELQVILKAVENELKDVTTDNCNIPDVSNAVCVCGKIIDNIDREHGMCHKCWGIVGD